jgi:DNA polymerase-3 subunit alpha
MLQGLGTDENALSRVVLLVQNHRRLPEPVRAAGARLDRNVVRAQAVCKLEWLRSWAKGLILLSGAQAGPVGQALLQGDESRASQQALQLAGCSRTASTSSCSAPAAPTTSATWPPPCSWPRA